MEKRIQNDLMAAMKAKNELRANTLRAVKAAILNEKSNGAHHEITDQDIIKLINKQIKLRKDAADIYTASNRPDLAEKELNELHVLEEYVPKKMNEEETRAAIETAISETGVSSQKEKGKLIGTLRQKYGETLDMQIAVPIIATLLKSTL